MSRAVVTTEAPAAPILLALYANQGLTGRIELSQLAALQLAVDLLHHVTTKRKRETMMEAEQTRRWERMIDAARQLDAATASPELILARLLPAFDACGAADLPAYAVGELVSALLRVPDDDDDDAY